MAIEQRTIELPEDSKAKLALKQRYQSEGWRIVSMTADSIIVEREKPTVQTEESTGGIRRNVKLTD